MVQLLRLGYKAALCAALLTIYLPAHAHATESTPSVQQAFTVQSGQHEEDRKQSSPYLPTTAVIIDAGHGGIDSGAFYGDIYEKDINLEVGKRLYAILQSRGIPTILNRTHDYALSDDNRWHRTSSRHLRDLSQRMGLAREIDHVIFISLHVNAVGNPNAHGPLVLHQQGGESALLARVIQTQLNGVYHTSKQPIAVNSFYVLKYVKSPAVLVELGFISNAEDRTRLTTPYEQKIIAEAIANGISHYFWIN
ncbi:N-acetylmuramoyl-L-alanine amidase [Paenibacillus septentrionalis]|uniref:N-acetylmuramoyl-L-alanine amidase n=1 Tax=Paenibacillus septentrionalis TaxID=429342 RepID=A0ABW1V147_9BACL